VSWWRALLGLAAIGAASPAAAWDNQGHRVSGELAYDRLMASDPAAVRAILAVMARHPDRARFERALGATAGETRERRLFGLMARWPDDVRETAYDRPEWHYAVKVVHGWTALGFYTAGDAMEQWPANRAAAFARGDAAARAVALCWLFHLTGDMHQPLHRGHRLDGRFPKSDRAGTVAWVRVPAGATNLPAGAVTDLHQVWDHGISLNGDEDAAVGALRARLSGMSRRVAVSGPAWFPTWVGESERLARDVGYSGAALGAARAKADAPVLGRDYLRLVREVSGRRVAEAGAHLGDVLRGFR
jgi:hypothetical protein